MNIQKNTDYTGAFVDGNTWCF